MFKIPGRPNTRRPGFIHGNPKKKDKMKIKSQSPVPPFDNRGMTLVGMTKKRGKFAGVYSIGNVYVGASHYVLERIRSHFNRYKSKKLDGLNVCNPKVFQYFHTCFRLGISPKIYLLDTNPMNEKLIKIRLGIPFSRNERFYHQTRTLVEKVNPENL